MIERHLQEAEQRIADGRELISQQRLLIAELEVDGHDTAYGLALLRTYEEIQEMLEADRNRLRQKLDGL